MTSQPYTLNKIQDKEVINTAVLREVLKQLEESQWNFVWKNLLEEDRDELVFMEKFAYPSPESLRETLKAEGNYSDEQIDTILVGLKDLPEYRG